MKRLIAACCAAFALFGCHETVQSSDYTTYYLSRDYAGHPADRFFQVYGYAEGVFDLSNGYRMYRWTSLRSPQPAARMQGDNYMMVDTYQGKIEHQYCELRIYTNKDDIIRSFAVAVDSAGKMGPSRCSEIFNHS